MCAELSVNGTGSRLHGRVGYDLAKADLCPRIAKSSDKLYVANEFDREPHTKNSARFLRLC